LSRDLETICLKCLEREPDKRYQSAAEVAEELARVAVGEPIRARPISPLERTWRWCRRRPLIAGLLASLFLSLSLGLLGVTVFWRRAEQNAAASQQSLYRSRMNLASVHLSNGDIAGVKEMLARIAADRRQSPQRGFEWGYFDSITAPLAVVGNHGDSVLDVAVSRDGNLCASIARDREIRVWDCRNGELVRTLRLDGDQFQSIDFSPTSAQLASGSTDGFVRTWEPLQNDRMVRQVHHGPSVALVRYSPDGKQLLSAGNMGAVRIWDVATGEVFAEIPTGKKSAIKDVRFSRDGTYLTVATEDGRLRLWNLATFQEHPQPERELDTPSTLQSFAISDDGHWLVTGEYHGVLTTLPLGDGEKQLHRSTWGRIDDIEFLPGTHVVAVVSSDGQLHVFDVDKNREVRAINTHGLALGTLARSAGGKFFVIGSGDGSVTRLQFERVATPSILWHDGPVRDVEFLPNGTLLATNQAGEMRVWDAEMGRPQAIDESFSSRARTISVQPRGRLIAAAGTEAHATVWDSETHRFVRELPAAPTGALAVQFSPSGRRLAVALRRGPIHGYAVDAWDKPLFELSAREAKASALAFSADDRFLAVAWDDGHLKLFDAATGESRLPAKTLKSEPSALTFCQDSRTLAIGTYAGEIHLWEIFSRSAPTVIKGHTGRINALAMLPDQRTLVSGSLDRHLKLWDVPTGELITVLAGHHRQVFSIAVSPDGQTIASGGLEGDVRIWRSGKPQ